MSRFGAAIVASERISSCARRSCCLVILAALGCSGADIDLGGMSGQGGGSSTAVTFSRDIHPILQMKCGKSGCHDGAGSFLPGHGSADVEVAYAQATRTGSGGIPVYEQILARVSSTDPSFIMPPSFDGVCMGALGAPGCVTQDEFNLIQQWVDQGRKK